MISTVVMTSEMQVSKEEFVPSMVSERFLVVGWRTAAFIDGRSPRSRTSRISPSSTLQLQHLLTQGQFPDDTYSFLPRRQEQGLLTAHIA